MKICRKQLRAEAALAEKRPHRDPAPRRPSITDAGGSTGGNVGALSERGARRYKWTRSRSAPSVS